MSLEHIERLIGNLGLPVTLLLGIGFLVYRYVPRLVDALLLFFAQAGERDERMLTIQQRQEETLRSVASLVGEQMDPAGDPRYHRHIFSTVRTNAALGHFAQAALEAADSLDDETRRSVVPHLHAIQEALK